LSAKRSFALLRTCRRRPGASRPRPHGLSSVPLQASPGLSSAPSRTRCSALLLSDVILPPSILDPAPQGFAHRRPRRNALKRRCWPRLPVDLVVDSLVSTCFFIEVIHVLHDDDDKVGGGFAVPFDTLAGQSRPLPTRPWLKGHDRPGSRRRSRRPLSQRFRTCRRARSRTSRRSSSSRTAS
jgi:hypothetical protein